MTDQSRDRSSDPEAQEQSVRRSPGGVANPTAERTGSSNSLTAGGLTGGTPAGGPEKTAERNRFETDADEEPRVRSGRDPDERQPSAESGSDPALPANDATLNTKI